MENKLSKRLGDIVTALPLKDGMRILEIGCGPGAIAREIANRFDNIYVLAIDRSAKAIELAKKNSATETESGKLTFIQSKIEAFELPENEELFDIAFAVRVGALDGRHPGIEKASLTSISKALKKNGKLYIDGGDPLKEISLKNY
ncbi:MAG: class I SAM-dependent methyltransferase [Chitinophagaceae bacterium]|nr:class I SAM-dependent methyltransferase [Chitinophagaceae bacterium]